MATVIDALIVTLGLNAKGFTQGAKTAQSAFKTTQQDAQRTAKNIEDSGKQAAQFFSKLRNEALTFFAVFTAGVGIKDFVAGTITGAAGLGRMAKNLDMSTRELNAWQKAAERAGGTAEGITAQLKESQSESAKYAVGLNPATIQAFAKYGGDFNAFKSGNTYLLERSRIIAELYAKSPARGALAAQELGISQENFDLIKQGPAALQALIAAQMKNSVVTEADAKKAAELQAKLLDLRDTLQATATKVLFALMPAIEGLLARFQKFADWAVEHKDDIAEWINNAVAKIGEFAKALDDGANAVGGWKVVIAGLIALNLLPTIVSIVSLTTAILGLGRAITGASAAGAAVGAGSVLGKLLRIGGVGAAALFHTDDLGAGEQQELARRRALGDKGPVMTGAGGGAGSTQATVIDSLMAKGWSRAQASGIAANLKQESSYNPGAVGDGGKAYGVAQWHPDRQAAFKKQFGKDIRGSSLEEQLAFVDHELREGNERRAGNLLKQQTGAGESAAIVSQYYERPADRLGEASRRAGMAQTIAAQEAARSAAWAAANPSTALAGAGAGRGSVSNTSTSDVNIEKIEVVTQATDATGIARDMAGALRKNGLVTQANTGLQ